MNWCIPKGRVKNLRVLVPWWQEIKKSVKSMKSAVEKYALNAIC